MSVISCLFQRELQFAIIREPSPHLAIGRTYASPPDIRSAVRQPHSDDDRFLVDIARNVFQNERAPRSRAAHGAADVGTLPQRSACPSTDNHQPLDAPLRLGRDGAKAVLGEWTVTDV